MNVSLRKKIIEIISNRILLLAIVIIGMFSLLTIKLFNLQIINGLAYEKKLTDTSFETTTVVAPRGTIYDRFGRPLAINKSAYTIKLDPGVTTENINDKLLNFANFLEENHETYQTDFPISKEKPYTFEFDESEAREKRWKDDMTVENNLNAEKTFVYLRKKFKVDETLSDEEAYKILAFRSLIYVNRNKMHLPITVSYDVKYDTVVKLSEHMEKFQLFYVDVQPLREYPGGMYVSHLVGYVHKITDREFETKEEEGYSRTDQIGFTGLERAFESNFRGELGAQVMEMSPNGRPLRTVDEKTTLPIAGDRLITTIDLEFQKASYNIMKDELKEILTNKLLSKSDKEKGYTLTDFFVSMVESNNISTKKIMESVESQTAVYLKDYVLKTTENYDPNAKEKDTIKASLEIAKLGIVDGIKSNDITYSQMLIILLEQGIITADETLTNKINSKSANVLATILQKIEEDEITPQMTNLDPSTGSILVVSVENGDVLASVTYPSFDNNEFVNYFNNDYWRKINDDPTTPMLNRAFMEARAPGSTFKMISAIAGLETGTITPTTEIHDDLVFKKAGTPFAKCWSSVSHGSINVAEALSVSCNYFFSEMAYRMGNAKENTTLVSIRALNKYMLEFGLNERTGVEIGEYRDTLVDADDEPIPLVISSPEYKKYVVTRANENATPFDYDWYEGNTTHTSFGQGYNNYTAASMAKYIATLASGGVRRDLHLLSKIESEKGELVETYTPRERMIDVDPKNLQAVYDGMMLVTTVGTAKRAFEGFEINVAGKTGTAQENKNRPDHASFGGFAPYENPQIAVYVSIPYGDSKSTPYPAAKIARAVIAEYMGLNAEPERGDVVGRITK